jgi:ABC-type protease/lipase transport system fused ATPase/permease subunit
MTMRALTWAAGFSLFCNLMLLAPVLYTLQVFDRVLASRSVPTMMLLLIGVAIAMAAMFVVDLVRAQVLAVQAEKVDAYLAPLVLRARALDRQDQQAGASQSDLAALRALMAGQGLIALFDLPWLLLFIGVIAVMHPLLGALAAAGAAAILGLAIVAERSGRAAREAYKSAATQSELQFRSIIGQSDAVRAMQMADGLVQAWMSTEGAARGWHRSLVSGSARLGAFGRLLRQPTS